jgi:hypothetical protein
MMQKRTRFAPQPAFRFFENACHSGGSTFSLDQRMGYMNGLLSVDSRYVAGKIGMLLRVYSICTGLLLAIGTGRRSLAASNTPNCPFLKPRI